VRVTLALTILLALPAFAHAAPPNVVLIMTDDQGYGDFGATGNAVIETPHLDAMAARSTWMRTFYVSPVCSPTRASLMTGRYNYRTRCIDTYLGRSMMEPEETTLAEVLRDAGYATGIFGKWHLGDNYPMRAIDQGFEEALIHRGGGLGQPADPPENQRRYTNPILMHNGEPIQTTGYCTDVYFDAAMKWIEQSKADNRPSFTYIATNAPHGPYHDVPEDLRKHYQNKDLRSLMIAPPASADSLDRNLDQMERIAAMITNVDQNVGRLFAKLDQLHLTEDTLVIFLVDNGPNTARYVGPFRGSKSQIHEGGVRSPLWMHWPGKLEAGYERAEAAAHIDLMPTILDACGVIAPTAHHFDGRSFWGLAIQTNTEWPTRPLVLQTHRGDQPVRYHHFMLRQDDWKLLHNSGFGREFFQGAPKFELYNLADDPREEKNLAEAQPEVVTQLRAAYDAWFDDVSSTRPDNYAPPRIQIGTPHENPTVLTRQDWRGGTWNRNSIGEWLVSLEAGTYEITAVFEADTAPETLELRVGDTLHNAPVPANTDRVVIQELKLSGGSVAVRAVLQTPGRERGVHQLVLGRQPTP